MKRQAISPASALIAPAVVASGCVPKGELRAEIMAALGYLVET